MNSVRKYAIAYLLSSTALVLPITPIWWVVELQIPLGEYLAILAFANLLVIALDIPSSFMADKISPKATYFLSLVLFGSSFLLTALWPSKDAFLLVSLIAALGESLRSGSNTSFLHSLSGDEKFREHYFRINKYFYLLTGMLFFVGVALFGLNHQLPFVLQALSFFGAAAMVLIIPIQAKPETRAAAQTGALREVFSLLKRASWRYLIGCLMLCLVLGYFNGLAQFQNRTVQVLINGLGNLGTLDPLWLTAFILFLGNVLTALGVNKKLEVKTKVISVPSMLGVLFAVAVLACYLLHTQALASAVCGYVLISLSKGFYRAEVSSLAMQNTPSSRIRTTWMSFINTLAVGIAAVLNFLVAALAGKDLAFAELLWVYLGLAAGLVVLVGIRMSRGARIKEAALSTAQRECWLGFSFMRHLPCVLLLRYRQKEDAEQIRQGYQEVTEISELGAAELYEQDMCKDYLRPCEEAAYYCAFKRSKEEQKHS